MSTQVTVLLTADAGGREQMEIRRVSGAFSRWSIDATVRTVQGSELEHAIRAAAASTPDLIVVGGGDGSIGTAAAVLAGRSIPLGVLPLGTLNHFAKDLGLSLELDEAVRTIAERHVRDVDVGEVNGHIFVNNSSIGLYPRAVETRDAQQGRHGWSKWPATLYATLAVVRRFRVLRVTIDSTDHVRTFITPFLFVGNNEYEMRFFSMGRRRGLDGGRLGLYVARTATRWGIARLALHALVGHLDQSREFESFCLSSVEIQSNLRDLRVALDGEVTRMKPPLRYRIRPRALQVIVPAGST